MQKTNTVRDGLVTVLVVYAAVVAILSVLVNISPSFPQLKPFLPLIAAVLFVSVPVVTIRMRKESQSDYGLAATRPLAELVFTIICSFAIFLPFTAGFHIYQTVFLHHAFKITLPSGFAALAVTHLVLVAIPEEVFYRGYVQGALKKRFGSGVLFLGARIGPAIIITSALFALGHFATDMRLMRLGVFFPSILFGWMREKSGGVTAPALMHAMSNILMAALERSYG